MSLIDVDKCDLIYYPSPLLTRRAEPVEAFDDNLRQCVDRMRVIMGEKKGIGLAAPQVGLLLRFFLIGLDGDAMTQELEGFAARIVHRGLKMARELWAAWTKR